MAAKNASGAERKRGNDLIRSYMSKGIPCMVEAVRGDGRIGLVGFVSELKDLKVDIVSGTAAAPALAA